MKDLRARLLVVAGVALALAAGALLSFRYTYEPDLWWHLAQGREAAAGHLARTNLFSFTAPDFPQPYTSWLFDLACYALYRSVGAIGVQAGQALVIAAALVLVYRAGRERADAGAALAVALFGVFVLEPRALPRPHVFSFVGLAGVAFAVERSRARGSARPLFFAVPLLALWANVHVEALFGVAFVAAYAASELAWPAALSRREARLAVGATACAALAVLATPYHLGIVRYLVENARVPEVIAIAELQPPYLPSYGAFFVWLALVALLLLSRPRELRPWEAAVTLAFAWLALGHLRFTALFFVATGPLVAGRVAARFPSPRGRATAIAVAAWAGLLLARQTPGAWLAQLGAGEARLANPGFFSRAGVDFIRRNDLGGPVFASNNLGGWLIWQRYPEARVFDDARLQAYPTDLFRRILDASRRPAGWDELVAGVDWAVLSLPRPNNLSGVGHFPTARWATVFWDDATQIVVRRDGRYGALADTLEYARFRPGLDPFGAEPRLDEAARTRLLAEAARAARESPEHFTALAVLCLAGNGDGCERARALGEARPGLHTQALRLARMAAVRAGAAP